MISTLVLSMLLSSLQRVSADESENIPNSPIKVLEENISDQSLYIIYYMTIDNQKILYIHIKNEYSEKTGAILKYSHNKESFEMNDRRIWKFKGGTRNEKSKML